MAVQGCQKDQHPTNIRTTEMSCTDLIITDQSNLYVDFGVHSSLDDHCQHQVVHGKLNMSRPPPPPYKRKIWHHAKSQKDKIKSAMENIDWLFVFVESDVDDMTQLFTSKCINMFSQYIPNEIITCDDQDPLRMTATSKSAIKCKHGCIISMSNVDGNPTTGNRCVRSVTRLLLKSPQLKMNTSPT